MINRIKSLFWNAREKRLRTLWRLAAYAVVLSTLMVIFLVILSFVPFVPGNLNLSLVTLISVILSTIIVGRWIDRRKILDFGLLLSREWWKAFAFGLGLGALLMTLIFLIGILSGSVQISGYFRSTTQSGSFLSHFFMTVLFFMSVGIYEEILLRGYLLVNLAEGFKGTHGSAKRALLMALLITSIIFGLLHSVNPNATWVSSLSLTVAGIFLGLGMVLTGRLGMSIGLHITWNLFQGGVFGFPVSGIDFGVTLIETQLAGPEWLTGGAFGPEAGVLGLVGMVIGSLLILLWLRGRGLSGLHEDLAEYQPAMRQG